VGRASRERVVRRSSGKTWLAEEEKAMPFQHNEATAGAVGEHFGKYVDEYHSDGGQVVAYLFEQDGWLIAHVTRPTGVKLEEITDRYVDDLYRFARERGFEAKFRMIYVEQ
jgi:hypothetical protein